VSPLSDTLRAQAAALRAQADTLDALAEREGTDERASEDDLIPLAEVRAPDRTKRRAARSGALPTVRLGRDLYVRRLDVADWVARESARANATRAAAEAKRQETLEARGPADPFDRALRDGRLRVVGSAGR
jgi:hypothetical protein